jgi:hypothetical protein
VVVAYQPGGGRYFFESIRFTVRRRDEKEVSTEMEHWVNRESRCRRGMPWERMLNRALGPRVRRLRAGCSLLPRGRRSVARSVLAAPAAVGHGSANGYTVYT